MTEPVRIVVYLHGFSACSIVSPGEPTYWSAWSARRVRAATTADTLDAPA